MILINKEYKQYLRSKHWQTVRAETLERAGGRCERCGYQTDRLQVHHLSYEHLGDESGEDVIAICPKCHMKMHGIKMQSGRLDRG